MNPANPSPPEPSDTALDGVLRRVRPLVRSLKAYAVQDASGMVKLDAMENPHRLSPDLRAQLGARLAEVEINRYPGASVEALRQRLARWVGLPAGCDLVLGNGSDELIAMLSLLLAGKGATVLAPTPGFVMYEFSARVQGLTFIGVPLTPAFELDQAAMLAAMREHRPAIVYLAYPNNPTANLWSPETMGCLVDEAAALGTLVVVDEAYQPFASRSWLEPMRAQPQRNRHVLLLRTLSKFGLAGVRLGYAVGASSLIHELDKLRPPYNVSVLNAECAHFALDHEQVFAEQAACIRRDREALLAGLGEIPGVQPFPSEANMVLARVPDAARWFEGLKARGVLVKNVSTMSPLLSNCLRVTVGTAAENAQLLAAMRTLT